MSRDDTVDVLIVRAGAAGSVAARHLAGASFSLVCLEHGTWVDHSEFWGD
ncbi:MAG: hypothetical protein AAFY02_21170 [Pseudomonadota bacterium]